MARRSWLVAAFCAVLAWPAAAAVRLDARGAPLPTRELEALFAPALRAPGDSAALAAALGRVVGRLSDDGWLDANAEGEWPDSATLAVRVTAGARRRVATLAWDLSREDSLLFAPALGVRVGDWASPARFAAGLERAVSAAEAAGHPYAQLGVGGWQSDSAGLHVRLSGAAGPRVTIDAVRVDGLDAAQPRFVERSMGRLAGMPYDPAAARVATLRLEQLGLFSSVEYAGLEGGSDWSRGRLVWRVREQRVNRFEGAVGVQGEAGAVGLARLDLGNLGGTGRAVGLAWQSRGRGLADFGARYTEPMVLGLPVRAEVSLAQQLQDTLYTRTRVGAKLLASLTAGERVEAGYEEERVVTPQGAVQQAAYQNTTLGLERDARDDVLQPRRGTRARVAVTQVFKRDRFRPVAGVVGTRTSTASALEGRAEWHRPLAARTGVTLEWMGAGRFGGDRVRPDYERWAVGGAATLRGQNEEAFRVDRWLLARTEWRWFVGARGERLSLFWDHAWMETRVAAPAPATGDRLDRVQKDGVGFGLRLPAAGGFVDLDYGLEPGAGALEGKIHLQLGTLF